MTLRLTPAELQDITGGRTQSAAQVRWLRAHGFWLAERDNLGGCLLTWDHYRAVCAGAAPTMPAPEIPEEPFVPLDEWISERVSELLVPLDVLRSRRQLYPEDPGLPESGIYFLFDHEGSLVYIGQSIAIDYRLRQHADLGRIPFTHFASVSMPQKALNIIECAYLHTHVPPFNRYIPNYGLGRELARQWAAGEIGS